MGIRPVLESNVAVRLHLKVCLVLGPSLQDGYRVGETHSEKSSEVGEGAGK